MSDEELVQRIRGGDTALFEVIMRRYNTRLYRVARAILRDDAEAEDVMQQAYVNAFVHLDQFADRAKFSTWLTKIAVYEALPETFRTIFMLRDVEGLSTTEVAECLGVKADTVKTRLFRARAHLRRDLSARIGVEAPSAFQFHASRCDRVVAGVMARLSGPRSAAVR